MAKYIVQHRRGTTEEWNTIGRDIIPECGELVLELDINNYHRLKIGDGVHTYGELAYLMAGDEIVTQVFAEAKPRVVTVELTTDWQHVEGKKYKQDLALSDITNYSRLDLQPSVDMIAEFQKLDLAFVTENKNGVITVYSVGDIPLKSYTMQATIIETNLNIEDDKIIGATVGTPTSKSDWNQTDASKSDYIKNKPNLNDVLRYTTQELTEEQKNQVRLNIGAGASEFSGSYNDLTDKPTIPSVEGLATEIYVDEKVAGLVGAAPEALNTLNEFASALGNDENFATTITTQIGEKASQTAVDDVNERIAKFEAYVTPQMYNAVGDGETDDSEAIQDALDSGKDVFFPAGTYLVTQSLVLKKSVRIRGVSGLTVITTNITDSTYSKDADYNTEGNDENIIYDEYDDYVFKSGTGELIESLVIQDIKFQNAIATNEKSQKKPGKFMANATALYMSNCRVYNYHRVFRNLQGDSFILNNRFTGIYYSFARSTLDTVIDGNYINCSRFGLIYKSKCISHSFNSTSFANNLVDYWYSVFGLIRNNLNEANQKSGTIASGSIVCNMFNRCVVVFHDVLAHLTVTGNMFTAITPGSVSYSDIQNLSSEHEALFKTLNNQYDYENDKDAPPKTVWSIIKFDHTVQTKDLNHIMAVVTFANNMGYDVEYYFYVADGVCVVAADCEFRGNQISTGTRNLLSTVDVGFRNTTGTEDSYNSLKNCYFDFWNMKEYSSRDEFPSASLYGNDAKSVKTFPFMKAVCQGDIYTNINGVWVKDKEAVVDLSGYLTEEDLDGYVTESKFNTEIALVKAEAIQQTPVFVNSIDDCTDTTKVYVLPDGNIYAYLRTEIEVEGELRPTFTNVKDQCYIKYGYKFSKSGGGYVENTGITVFAVPVPTGKTSVVIRFKGATRTAGLSNIYGGVSIEALNNNSNIESYGSTNSVNLVDETYTFNITGKPSEVAYLLFHMNGDTETAFADVIITVDEPIEYTSDPYIEVTEAFASTGHAFVPADYEARILALEEKIAALEAIIGQTS